MKMTFLTRGGENREEVTKGDKESDDKRSEGMGRIQEGVPGTWGPLTTPQVLGAARPLCALLDRLHYAHVRMPHRYADNR